MYIQDLADHDADAVLVFVGCKRCSYTVSSICTKIFVDKCEDFVLKVCMRCFVGNVKSGLVAGWGVCVCV